MIITCEKCSTSFNLDDSFIKESGSKVRCSVCKDIFTAYPAPIDLELNSETSEDLSLETDLSDDQSFDETDDFQMEDSDFSLEETEMSDSELSIENSDLEIDAPEFEPDEIQSDDSDEDFSFEDNEFEMETEESPDDQSDEFEFEETDTSDTFEMDEGELEIEEGGLEFEPMDDEETPDLVIEDESPELESDETVAPGEELSESTFSEEDEFELEFDVDDESTAESDDTPSPLDEPELEVETESKDDENILSIEETDNDEPPEITPEEDFSEYDKVLEQETEPDAETLEEETILIDDTEEEAAPAPTLGNKKPLLESRHRTRRRKKKPLVGAPVLILLLIFLLIIGAYIASIMTGYKIPYLSDIKIPYIEQLLKKPAPEVNEAKPVPNQKSVNGRFVTNTTVGTLFVITGRVENPASISYSHIKILGTLITKGKTEAKTKTAYCGNIVSEEMLKTGNISDINKILMTQTGNLNANVGVKPGATIPFMVVFSDLPEKLQNFTVKVTTFDKATN